jgi:glycosyltransferase involved in cell wall biosynthesis
VNLKVNRGTTADRDLSTNSPRFPNVGVLGIVPDEWGGIWQPRHYILTRLATFFNIVWVNPAREWRDVRFRRAPGQGGRNQNGQSLPAFSIYEPEMWLPKVYRPSFLDSITTKQRLHRARSLLIRRGCDKIILYLWRPYFESALNLISHDLSCYHIDDEYSFSPVEQQLDLNEVRLIKRANQIFIHSPALLEKKGHLNPHTLFTPNGVDYSNYVTPHDEPEDLRNIPHPRMGYVGNIKVQLDFALLISLAERHPEWSFVFVGGKGYLGEQASLAEKLIRMPNVHSLGLKPVSSLPAYTQHFDVCMMCYVVDGYTKFIYPLKLHEYLASGRPVVGVPIPSLLEFSHVIRLARTSDEWSRALADSLSSSACSVKQINARRRIALNYDWDKLTRNIAQVMCDRLGLDLPCEF